MKFRVILACLLIAASLIAMPVISVIADSRREAVEVYENILLGSPEDVEGVQVDVLATYDDHLFWNVSHKYGANPETNTEFEYSASAKRSRRFLYNNLITCYCEMYYGYTGRLEDIMSDDFTSAMPLEPAKDLVNQTPEGQTKSFTVSFRDYYEYFPLYFYTNSAGEFTIANLDEDDIKILNDYFRIPVPDDLKVDITIDRTSANIGVDMEPHNQEGNYAADFGSYAVISGNKLIFTFNFSDYDTSHIKGGYGIYTFDLPENKNDTGWTKSIKTAIPLDPDLSVMDMKISEDGERLIIMYIDENSALRLSVYSLDDMAPMQTLELGGSNIYYASFFWNGDNLLVTNDFVSYAEPDDNGIYEIKASASATDEYDIGYYLNYPLKFAYDGERLVIASYGRYSPVSWILAVMDSSGLKYISENHTNLNAPIIKSEQGLDRYDTYYWGIQYSDIDPLNLTLN